MSSDLNDILDFRYEQHVREDIIPYLSRRMFQRTYKEVWSPLMWRNTTERRSSYSLRYFATNRTFAIRRTSNDLHLDKTVPLNVKLKEGYLAYYFYLYLRF